MQRIEFFRSGFDCPCIFTETVFKMNIKKIIIAVEDGATAEKVASAGFDLGKQLNAEIALVSIIDTTIMMSDGPVTPNEMVELMKNDFRKNIRIIISKIFGNFPVSLFIGEGNPHDAILKIAHEWEADLIVLGTHGRKGIPHLLLGSVAEKIVRHSEKPLFILPTR